MDKGFKRKSDAVFEALGAIATVESGVVFLGGSAIQASLGKPRRLSIDLDVAFDSDPRRLAEAVQSAGFSITGRPCKNPLFVFYKAAKDGVEIKLDISRFRIRQTERQTPHGIEVLIPTKSYFLASKLSSLAHATIGRSEREPTQIIKDIFDIDCLLDEKAPIRGMKADWEAVISDQNHLRSTSFGEAECAESVRKTLMGCLSLASTPAMPLNALSTFDDYLLSGHLSRQDFVAMAARTLMLLVHMDDDFHALDAQINTDFTHKLKMAHAEKELLKAGVLPAGQVHELKVVAPKALLHVLYWSHKRRVGNPVLM